MEKERLTIYIAEEQKSENHSQRLEAWKAKYENFINRVQEKPRYKRYIKEACEKQAKRPGNCAAERTTVRRVCCAAMSVAVSSID